MIRPSWSASLGSRASPVSPGGGGRPGGGRPPGQALREGRPGQGGGIEHRDGGGQRRRRVEVGHHQAGHLGDPGQHVEAVGGGVVALQPVAEHVARHDRRVAVGAAAHPLGRGRGQGDVAEHDPIGAEGARGAPARRRAPGQLDQARPLGQHVAQPVGVLRPQAQALEVLASGAQRVVVDDVEHAVHPIDQHRVAGPAGRAGPPDPSPGHRGGPPGARPPPTAAGEPRCGAPGATSPPRTYQPPPEPASSPGCRSPPPERWRSRG